MSIIRGVMGTGGKPDESQITFTGVLFSIPWVIVLGVLMSNKSLWVLPWMLTPFLFSWLNRWAGKNKT